MVDVFFNTLFQIIVHQLVIFFHDVTHQLIVNFVCCSFDYVQGEYFWGSACNESGIISCDGAFMYRFKNNLYSISLRNLKYFSKGNTPENFMERAGIQLIVFYKEKV